MIDQLASIVKNVGQQLVIWRTQKRFGGVVIGKDFKAEVDLLAHNMLVDALQKVDPTIPVISEEDVASMVKQRPNIYWLIDPIDGTLSFVKGFAGFVTQVALIEHNRPILAAMYAPMFDELYTAQINQGAFLNDQRLILDSKKTAQVLIDNTPSPQGTAALIFDHLKLSGYRESGSTSLKICRVAQGQADIFFKDVPVRDWDLAAPQLILQEAGGNIVKLNGEPFLYQSSYEHNGLVAAVNDTECQRVVQFFKHTTLDAGL